MKKLNFNEMEVVQGGWSWEKCAVSAGLMVMQFGWEAAAIGGWVGVGALAGTACVLSNME